MKTIFIATDFSSSSHNASKYGVELASVMGAKIILFHAYTVPLSIPESYVIVNSEDVKKTAEEYLLEEVLSLRKSSFQPIEIIAVEGPATDSIITNAKKYDDCLIVSGMKGSGKNLKKVFGSTATGLARKTSMPLLIVPESATFKTIKRIALASDIDYETNIHTIDLLKEVGSVFDSKIYIVRVLKNNLNVVDELTYRSDRLLNKLKPLDTEYQFPRADDVTTALEEFSVEYNVDVLSIIPQHHSLLERIFIKSETRELIFHTNVPLLILPEITEHSSTNKKTLQKQHS